MLFCRITNLFPEASLRQLVFVFANHSLRYPEHARTLSIVVSTSRHCVPERSSDKISNACVNKAESSQNADNDFLRACLQFESYTIESPEFPLSVFSTNIERISSSATICTGRCSPSARILSRSRQQHQSRSSWHFRRTEAFVRRWARCASSDLAW